MLWRSPGAIGGTAIASVFFADPSPGLGAPRCRRPLLSSGRRRPSLSRRARCRCTTPIPANGSAPSTGPTATTSARRCATSIGCCATTTRDEVRPMNAGVLDVLGMLRRRLESTIRSWSSAAIDRRPPTSDVRCAAAVLPATATTSRAWRSICERAPRPAAGPQRGARACAAAGSAIIRARISCMSIAGRSAPGNDCDGGWYSRSYAR